MAQPHQPLWEPSVLKWLYPGMRVKRWLTLVLLGVIIFWVGLSLLINARLLTSTEEFMIHFFALFPGGARVARWLNGATLLVVGTVFFALGLKNMVRSIITTLLPEGADNLAGRIFLRRQLERGPKIVVIGGGTGLATMLRGLKAYSGNLTAIVTVADDGGSSGRLRSEMGVLPPGDIRMCLAALADTEPLMERLFQYRFGAGSNGLAGHTFGNLFIATMTAITGDFEQAVKESSKVLAVRGQVLPSTLEDVVLMAEMEDGSLVSGESDIAMAGKRIRRVYLQPEGAEPLPEALAAIQSADAVIIGPGSLYTSLLPNLLVKGLTDALKSTKALRVYVCNVMTQPGETDGYSAADHLQAIVDHAGPGVVDAIVVNTGPVPEGIAARYREQGQFPVAVDAARLGAMGVFTVAAGLINRADLVRHDSERLAQTIVSLISRRLRVKRVS